MKNLYFYAEGPSIEALSDHQQKVVLIGSDFGYGNFGDVLQHLNTVRLVKESGRYATVSVMAANAIGFSGFPDWAKGAYGVDSIIYVSEYPLILDERSPKLEPVSEIQNLAAVYLYGGGFLNDMWGDYVLSVASYFLRLSPEIAYFVSGQQITAPYQNKVISHVREFNPRLFGVRDEISRQCLREAGFDPLFSFDDATEALLELTQRVHLQPGNGLLLHLNSSDYTANLSLQKGIGYELSILKGTAAAGNGVTVLQAFRDARQEVLDSTETIKKIDYLFPFFDYRIVDLVGLLFGERDFGPMREISGQFTYSCSYHIALWMQLAGIPCWLRSSNPFYDQKSRALQVAQDFEAFVREPKLADHRANLERRALWRSMLIDGLTKLPEANNLCRLDVVHDGPAPWLFFFKGMPTLQEKLADATQLANWQRERADGAERELEEAREEIAVLGRRIEALSAQLTELGHEIHQQQASTNTEIEKQYLDRLKHAESTLAEIYRSRSWRLTRPLRGGARYIRYGYFDSHGKIGIFAMIQQAAQCFPISAHLRAKIDRLLLHRLKQK